MRATLDLLDLQNPDPKAALDERSAESVRQNRHRGLRSFLTRSFFLGQIIAFEQFVSGKAQASPSDDPAAGNASDSDTSGANAGGAAAAALPAAGAAEETGVAIPVDTVQAMAGPGVPLPALNAVDVPSVSGAQAAADHAAGPASLGGDTLASIADDAPTSPESPISESPPLGGAPVDTLPPGAGSNPVGTVTEPVLDLVSGIGETTEGLLDTVGETVGDVVELVDVTVDTVVEVVHETVATLFDVLHSATSSLPLVGPVLGGVTATLETVVSPTLETVTSTLTGVVDVVTDTLSDAAHIFPALGDVVGSGVIPALTETVSGVLNPDALFAEGKYTDLNITLQSDIVQPVGGVVSTVVSVTDTLLGGLDDLATDDLGPVGDLAFGLTGLLNDTTKGGLAELFS